MNKVITYFTDSSLVIEKSVKGVVTKRVKIKLDDTHKLKRFAIMFYDKIMEKSTEYKTLCNDLDEFLDEVGDC